MGLNDIVIEQKLKVLTNMTALTLFSAKGNSRSPSSWIFKKVSTRSSASNLPLLVVMLSLCSLTIFWSILSTLSCSFSSLLLIPVTWSTHFTEGKTSAAQKPVASSAISVTAPMNESWSLHFFPKSRSCYNGNVTEDISSLRLIVDPECEAILLMTFDTSSSLINWKDLTRLALRSSVAHSFRTCLQ